LEKDLLYEVVVVGKRLWGFFFGFFLVFNQSHVQGWGRGGEGVAGQHGMREHRAYLKNISIPLLGW